MDTTIHRRQAKTWPSIRIALAAAIQTAFLPPSPPAEEATARKEQAGEASTSDGAGYGVPVTLDDLIFGAATRRTVRCAPVAVDTASHCR